MKTVPFWLGRFFAWRSSQSTGIRWLFALLLFLAALSTRLLLGKLHGANPVLAFYPALLLTTVCSGWRQAGVLLVLAAGTGAWLFVPADEFLMPVAWVVVGSFNIATIAVLDHVIHELIAAEGREENSTGNGGQRTEASAMRPLRTSDHGSSRGA